MKLLQPGVPMRKSLNEEHSCVVIKKTAGIRTVQNWGTAFHFACVRSALVEVEVLFCRSCTFHCDCAGIARQASQYSGSVAYLTHAPGIIAPSARLEIRRGREEWLRDLPQICFIK